MTRAQCKDEAHDGDTAWVNREDCLLVMRSVGGKYNRAARLQESLICLACASRIVASIEAQGGPQGHRLHNRWSISSLQNAYARFRRSRGLEPKDEIGGRPKYVRVEGQQIRVELGARTPESWEVLATVKEDVPVERASTAVRVAWGTDVVGEIGVHEGRRIFKARVARLDGGKDDSERPVAEEIVPSTTAPDAWDVPEFDAMYGQPDDTEASPYDDPESIESITDAEGKGIADWQLATDPDLKAEALTQEEYFGDDLALEPGGDPSPRSYDVLPTLSTEQYQVMANDDPHVQEIRRLIGPADGRPWWLERKAEPDPNVPLETAEEQAAFYEWVSKYVGIELTEAQKEQAKRRLVRGLPEDATVHHLITGEPTTSAADLLRMLRERQGRPLHEARHLNALPRIEVSKPDLQQKPYSFLQTDPIPGRVQMAQVRDRDVALAYGGLVPRKKGEFHHHFEVTPEGPLSACTHCGNRLYDDSGPCPGPKAKEWEARMQERADLKDRLFHLAYGMSTKGHAEAADEMAKFNAETLRLFPERFREPTAEELKHREEFNDMIAQLSKAPIVEVPLTEAEERYLERARRQQDELNEQIRQAKETAWAEGWNGARIHGLPRSENPYRRTDRD